MSRLFEQGGTILAAILVLSVVAWTVLAHKWWRLRAELGGGEGWIERALASLGRGDRDAARDLAREHRGVYARLLDTGLDVRTRDKASFRKRMRPVLDSEVADLHQGLDMVAAVGTVAPLLGLLGTVFGMVDTFGVLTSHGTVEIDELTEGISQALLTTQAGLLIALPLLVVHRLLRSRLDRHAQGAELLLHHLEGLVPRRGPAASGGR